jgi:hypothetical protein
MERTRRPWLALAVLLDTTIVNVALPSLICRHGTRPRPAPAGGEAITRLRRQPCP